MAAWVVTTILARPKFAIDSCMHAPGLSIHSLWAPPPLFFSLLFIRHANAPSGPEVSAQMMLKRCRDDLDLGTVLCPATENIDFLHFVDPSRPSDRTDQYLLDNVNLAACRKQCCRPSTLRRIRLAAIAARYRRDLDDAWFQRKRLDNVCWRRMAKNMLGLPHMSPMIIDWDKLSDSTWLYAPRVDRSALFCSSIATISVDRNAAAGDKKGAETEKDKKGAETEDEKDAETEKEQERAEPEAKKRAEFEAKAEPDAKAEPRTPTDAEGCDMDSATSAQSIFSSDTEYELDLSSVDMCFEMDSSKPVARDKNYLVKPILKHKKGLSFSGFEQMPKGPGAKPDKRSKSVSFNFIVTSRETFGSQPLDFHLLDERCLYGYD